MAFLGETVHDEIKTSAKKNNVYHPRSLTLWHRNLLRWNYGTPWGISDLL